MTSSSYLQYLPPILWVPESDPEQTLARQLCIYEKVLTEFPVDGAVIRGDAVFDSAKLQSIVLSDELQAARFAVGDQVTIAGTAERREIVGFTGPTLHLDANLVGSYGPGGVVRIADLVPGQRIFRVSNAERLLPGYPLSLRQASRRESLVVHSLDGSFVTLAFGLSQGYLLAPDAVPVLLVDEAALIHKGQPQASLERQIDELANTFNPWRTRPEFLPWLASWVALTLQPDWSEYQRRKLIAGMSKVYQQRGLKQGIYTYLDIYAVTDSRPRVVVDDGDAVLHGRFAADRSMRLRAIAHSHTVQPTSAPAATVTALLHPTGLAVDSANRCFVCDPADVSLAQPRRPALWRMSAAGEVDFAAVVGLPMPMPMPIFSGNPLRAPCAVAIDATDRVCVLDSGNIVSATAQKGAIYRFAPPAYAITTLIDGSTVPAFPAVHPVDLLIDGSGAFVVLDRGLHPLGNPPSGPSSPQIVVVTEPLAVAVHPLAAVREPTAILGAPKGQLLVADARDQSTTAPAEIFSVDPAAGWTQTPLLAGVPAGKNPLVFPTGMVWESPGVLLVCDSGLRRAFVGDPGNRTMAEPPHIYRVDLTAARPSITRVTMEPSLVSPTKMARDRAGTLLITDRGESMGGIPSRNWRAGHDEFGVVIYFSNQRPTTIVQRNEYRRGITRVVESELVGQTAWWMNF